MLLLRRQSSYRSTRHNVLMLSRWPWKTRGAWCQGCCWSSRRLTSYGGSRHMEAHVIWMLTSYGCSCHIESSSPCTRKGYPSAMHAMHARSWSHAWTRRAAAARSGVRKERHKTVKVRVSGGREVRLDIGTGEGTGTPLYQACLTSA